jgi:hypothetical protein
VHACSLLTTRSVLPWGHRRSSAIGLSCLFFCAPLYIDRSVRWPLQALISLMSDYVHHGVPSRWHVADRWLASGNVLFELGRALEILPPWQVALLAGIPLAVKLCGTRCAASNEYEHYVVFHVGWHALATASCLFIEQEFRTPTQPAR